jgi:hypothetical protein
VYSWQRPAHDEATTGTADDARKAATSACCCAVRAARCFAWYVSFFCLADRTMLCVEWCVMCGGVRCAYVCDSNADGRFLLSLTVCAVGRAVGLCRRFGDRFGRCLTEPTHAMRTIETYNTLSTPRLRRLSQSHWRGQQSQNQNQKPKAKCILFVMLVGVYMLDPLFTSTSTMRSQRLQHCSLNSQPTKVGRGKILHETPNAGTPCPHVR